MAFNLTVIAWVYGIASLVGLFPLAGARGRPWTVPVWAFLALPCLVCFAGSLPTRLDFGFVRRAARQPNVGGFAGLEAFLVVNALVIFDLIAVIVALLVPPRRAWTWKSATGGFIAAVVSAAWCLFLSSMDPDAVSWTRFDTGTFLIAWVVAWLAGMVVGGALCVWKYCARNRQNQAMEQNRDSV